MNKSLSIYVLNLKLYNYAYPVIYLCINALKFY